MASTARRYKYGANNDELVLVLNEDNIDEVANKVSDDIDRIITDLNQIKEIFYNMNDYFKGSVNESVQNKFLEYSDQYTTVKDNLNSYYNDLVAIKNMIKAVDTKTSSDIDVFTQDNKQDTDSKLSEVEEKNNQILASTYTANITQLGGNSASSSSVINEANKEKEKEEKKIDNSSATKMKSN